MEEESLTTHGMYQTPEAFAGMYEANVPFVYRFLFWRTQDTMLAQDLTSTVFEKAWRTRASFQGGSARAWLLRIARTTLIDHWRKRQDIVNSDVVAEVTTDEDLQMELDRHMRLDRLRAALKRLPGDMRGVVESRFMAGQSARQTAEKLGLSEVNVRVLQYRALKKLRGFLQ